MTFDRYASVSATRDQWEKLQLIVAWVRRDGAMMGPPYSMSDENLAETLEDWTSFLPNILGAEATETVLSFTTSKGKWARLCTLLDWVMIEGGMMDPPSIPLTRQEIIATLRAWENLAGETFLPPGSPRNSKIH